MHALIVQRSNMANQNSYAIEILQLLQLFFKPFQLISGVVSGLQYLKVEIIAAHCVDGDHSGVWECLSIFELERL